MAQSTGAVSVELPPVQPSPANLQRRAEKPFAPRESGVCCGPFEKSLLGSAGATTDDAGEARCCTATSGQCMQAKLVSSGGGPEWREISHQVDQALPQPEASRSVPSRPNSRRSQDAQPPPLPALCSVYPLHPAFLLTRSLRSGTWNKAAAPLSCAAPSAAERQSPPLQQLRRRALLPRASSASLGPRFQLQIICERGHSLRKSRPVSAGASSSESRRSARQKDSAEENDEAALPALQAGQAEARRVAHFVLSTQRSKSRFVKRRQKTFAAEAAGSPGWSAETGRVEVQLERGPHSNAETQRAGCLNSTSPVACSPQPRSPECFPLKEKALLSLAPRSPSLANLASPTGRRYSLLQPQHETLFGPLFLAVQTEGEECGALFAVKAVKKERLLTLLEEREKTRSSPRVRRQGSSVECLLRLIPETPLAEVFFTPLTQKLPHVHSILEVFQDSESHYVVSPWAEGGDLLDLLRLVSESALPRAKKLGKLAKAKTHSPPHKTGPCVSADSAASPSRAEDFLSSTWRRAIESLSCGGAQRGSALPSSEEASSSAPSDSPQAGREESLSPVALKRFSRGAAGGLEEGLARRLLFQALVGLVGLHRRGVSLQDFSLENCLLFVSPPPSAGQRGPPGEDWALEVRVCDPGQAVCFSSKASTSCTCGASAMPWTDALQCFCPGSVEEPTVFAGSFGKAFRPPESFPLCSERQTGLPYLASRVDSWCFGWSAFYLLTGVALFERAEPPSFLGARREGPSAEAFRPACRRWKLLRSGRAEELWEELGLADGGRVSRAFLDLVERLVREEGRSRLSLVEALRHPWFDSIASGRESPAVRLQEIPELHRLLLKTASSSSLDSQNQRASAAEGIGRSFLRGNSLPPFSNDASRLPPLIPREYLEELMPKLCIPGRPSFSLLRRTATHASARPSWLPHLPLRLSAADRSPPLSQASLFASLEKPPFGEARINKLDASKATQEAPPSASAETSATTSGDAAEGRVCGSAEGLPARNSCIANCQSGLELKFAERLQRAQQQRQRRDRDFLKTRRSQALERLRLGQKAVSPSPSQSAALPTQRSSWGALSWPVAASSNFPQSLVDSPLASRGLQTSPGIPDEAKTNSYSGDSRAAESQRETSVSTIFSSVTPQTRLSLPGDLWHPEGKSRKSRLLSRAAAAARPGSSSEKVLQGEDTSGRRQTLPVNLPSRFSKAVCRRGGGKERLGSCSGNALQMHLADSACWESFKNDLASSTSTAGRLALGQTAVEEKSSSREGPYAGEAPCVETSLQASGSSLSLPKFFSIATPSSLRTHSVKSSALQSSSSPSLTDTSDGAFSNSAITQTLDDSSRSQDQQPSVAECLDDDSTAGLQISVKPLLVAAAASGVGDASLLKSKASGGLSRTLGAEATSMPSQTKGASRSQDKQRCTYSAQGPQRAAARAERRRLQREGWRESQSPTASSRSLKSSPTSFLSLSKDSRLRVSANPTPSARETPPPQPRGEGSSARASRGQSLKRLTETRTPLSLKSATRNGARILSDLSGEASGESASLASRPSTSAAAAAASAATGGHPARREKATAKAEVEARAAPFVLNASSLPLGLSATVRRVRSLSPAWLVARPPMHGMLRAAPPVGVVASSSLWRTKQTWGAQLSGVGDTGTRLRQLSPAVAKVASVSSQSAIGGQNEDVQTQARRGLEAKALGEPPQPTYRQLLQYQLFVQQQFVKHLNSQQRRFVCQSRPVLAAAPRFPPFPAPGGSAFLN